MEATFTYTSEKNLLSIYDRVCHKSKVDLKSKEDFLSWQKKAKSIMKELLALDQYESCKPLPLSYELTDIGEDLVRERVILQAEKDIWVPFYILRKKDSEKKDAVLIPATEDCGKFGVIRSEDYEKIREKLTEEEKEVIETRYQFTEKLAREGKMVVVFDTRGKGERREWMDHGEEKFTASSHRPVNNTAIALGENLAGQTVYEMQRILDYLDKREDCTGNYAAAGEYSGGALVLYLAAVEDRVDRILVDNWFMGFRNSLLVNGGGSACTYIPFLWIHFDCADIAAIALPGKFYIQSGTDELINGRNGIENVKPQVEILEQAVSIAGGELIHCIKEGKAGFLDVAAIEFLR